MPKFQSDWEKLVDYLAELYPATSMGTNANGLVSNISNDDLTQVEFDAMVTELKEKFPTAFEVPTVTEEPAVVQRPTKICPECGEEILAVARKCRYCQSILVPSPPEKTT